MVKCSYCDEDIEFLPFKCKYCGNQYCKKHRIPENHECSFEFLEINNVRSILRSSGYSQSQLYGNYTERNVRRGPRQSRISLSLNRVTQLTGTQIIMIINLIMFILAFFLENTYLFLSIQNYIPPNFLYHTILTAMIIPAFPSPYNIISLIFFMLILYFTGRSIEGRFGRNLFLKIYFIGALITGGVVIALQLIFSLISSLFLVGLYYSSMGGIMALVAFISRLNPEQEVTFFLYFVPIRIRMKHLLWIFIGFELLGLLFGGIIQTIANISGALGGFLVINSIIQPQGRPRFY